MTTFRYHAYTPAAALEIFGEDAAQFLQSQFSNDLRPARQEAVYGLWLDAKGRVQADSHILQTGDESFTAFSLYGPATTIVQKLEKHIIADDVEMEDHSTAVQGLFLQGESLSILCQELGLPLPLGKAWQRWRENVLVFAGHRGLAHGWECLGPAEAIAQLLQDLKSQAPGQPFATEELEAARIEAGIPGIPQDVGPGDTPLDADALQSAYSLRKGCYLGQEVIARTKNKGRSTKTLCRVQLDQVPETLPAAIHQDGKPVGQLTSAQATATQSVIGLAMLKRKALDEAAPTAIPLTWDAPQGVWQMAHAATPS